MRPPHRPRRRRLVLLFTVVTVAALAGASVVSAHANLIDASPASGEQVEEPPDELVLTYSEGVQIADVSVESADGERIDGDARIDEDDRAIVHVPLEDVENGTYVVQWEVLSVDGHTTSGSFFFVIGDEPPTREHLLETYGSDETDDDSGVPLLETGVRSAYLGGTIVLVGAPLALLFAVYPAARRYDVGVDAADGATRRLLGGATLALLLGVVGLGFLRFPAQRSISAETIWQFLGTDLGRSWVVQLASVLGIGGFISAHVRRPTRLEKPSLFAAVIVLALWLQLLLSTSSHSAAIIGPVGGFTDFGHLVGAALWLGGLAALAVVAPRYLRRADDAEAMTSLLIRRFTVLAAVGVVVAGATGLVIAAWHVPTVDTLGTTRYGSALSVKTLLVLLAIGLGGVNRFLLGRHLRQSPDRHRDPEPVWAGPASVLFLPARLLSGGGTVRAFVRTVRFELALLIVVLVLSGMITAIPTAADVSTVDEDDPEHSFEAATEAGELTVRVVPGHVGPNVFDLRIVQNGTPVETDDPVTLILRNPERDVQLPEVELDPIDEGTYSTVEPIPSEGRWEVRVTTWANDTYVSERFEMNVSDSTADQEMSPNDGEQSARSGQFGTLLQYGAGGLVLGGGVGVGYEVRRLRRKRE